MSHLQPPPLTAPPLPVASMWAQALASAQAGNWQAAQAACEALLAVQPAHLAALNLLAHAALMQGHLALSTATLSRALALAPRNVALHCNAGQLHVQQNNWPLAQHHFEQALAVDAQHAQAHWGLTHALEQQHAWPRALHLHQSWLARHAASHPVACGTSVHISGAATAASPPDTALAWLGCARCLRALQQHAAALHAAEQALLLVPGEPAALLTKADMLYRLNQPDDASQAYAELVAKHPDHALAWHNFGVCELARQRLPSALQALVRAHALAPDQPFLPGLLLDVHARLADWRGYAQRVAELTARLHKGELCAQPFQILAHVPEPVMQRALAERFGQYVCSQQVPVAAPATPQEKTPLQADASGTAQQDGRITLAYFSADFNNHATAVLLAELIELHDRSRFRVLAYAFSATGNDVMERRLRAAFDGFHAVHDWPAPRIAAHARAQGVDIAIDLKGYTHHARPEVFAHRPAPVVVNYLGYPGTMGMASHHYLVADAQVLPPELAPHYSECVVRLPHSYQCNDRQRAMASAVPARAELGLPDDAMVYACFNHTYKLNPAVFDVWMDILRRVPRAVLWLLHDDAQICHHLRREAMQRQVDGRRLHFAPRVPLAAHMARMRCADLFLDTWPCNAHTTASDALWAGMPVLTLPGQTFAARVGASLLHAVGLPDLVASSVAHYADLAVQAATHPAMLARWQQALRRDPATLPLFDTPRYARHIEAAYTTMHAVARQGLPPRSFDVPADAAMPGAV